MFVTGIPSNQIVHEATRRNKDYELDFVNTESNNDVYTLQVFLRRNQQEGNEHYKTRLILTSNILAYPALDMVWVFGKDEYELASRVYHRICDEVDDVKTDYDRSMMPVATLAAKIREAAKPISMAKQEKTHIPSVDETSLLSGVSDWRISLYSGRYPNLTRKEKEQIMKHEGNQESVPLQRREYKTREKY